MFQDKECQVFWMLSNDKEETTVNQQRLLHARHDQWTFLDIGLALFHFL